MTQDAVTHFLKEIGNDKGFIPRIDKRKIVRRVATIEPAEQAESQLP